MSMDGRITWSGYLWPSTPLPQDLSPSTTTAQSERLIRRSFSLRNPSLTHGLTYGALGGAAVAAGLLAGAWAQHSAYVPAMGACLSGGCQADPEASEADLERLRGRTNTLSVASGVVGVGAAGLGAVALVTIRW